MKNRQRIMKTNLYDFLMTLNSNIQRIYKGCILEALTGNKINCDQNCDKCMQEWLNKEE